MSAVIFACWVITVKSLSLVALVGMPAIAMAFFIYLVPQLLLVCLARFMRNTIPFLAGSLSGIVATTTAVALWENKWVQGPNSMPFAIYLFVAVPALALGILVAGRVVRHRLAVGPIAVAVVALICETPVALYVLYRG